MVCRFVVFVFLGMCSGLVSAVDATAVKSEEGWKGAAELGVITTRGNTSITTSNAKLRLEYSEARWNHQLRLESVRAEDSGIVTVDRFSSLFRSKYQFSQRGYYYGSVRYEDDAFAGFEQRTTEIIGYGRNLYKGERFLLDFEAGIGARQTERTDNTSSDEGVIHVATNMAWKISETSSITEELFIERGDENTISESTTNLKVKINSALALKLGLRVKNNSEVPAGKKNTDTETAVTLVYDF